MLKKIIILLVAVGFISTLYAADEAKKAANIEKASAEVIKAAASLQKAANNVKKSTDAKKSTEEILIAVDEMKKAADSAKKAAETVGSTVDDGQKFSGHAELSYANTSGNTDSQDIAGNLKLNIPFYSNEIRFIGNTLYSKNTNYDTHGDILDTQTTKNRWDAELNYDYHFSDAWAFNYLAGGKGDKFSTFVYQAYTGPGLIWKAYKSKEQELKFQGNLLWAWDEHRQPYQVTSNDTSHSYAAYQLSMDYGFQFTESSKFIQYVMYRSEFEDMTNYFAKSKTAVESKMSDIFSLGVSYTIDYTNNKAAGVRSYVDGVFLASLIADF